MNKIKVIVSIFLMLGLLTVGACKAEPVTSTVTKTSTVTPAAQTVTVTPAVQTETVIQTQTFTVTTTGTAQTSSTTKTATSSTITKTSTTTTTSTTTFTPVTSPDGKLQVTSAVFPGGDTSYIRVKVKNLSDEALNARVTIQFLTASGEVAIINDVEQIKVVDISNLAAGAEKTFVQEVDRLDASSSAQQDEVAGFNISIVVIS